MALKAMVFVDGNWFYHSRQVLFNLKNEDGFELDYRRISSLISEWLSESFKKEVDVVRCLYFGVVQTNKLNCNSAKQIAFYDFLARECSIDVITSTIDYKSDVSISEERAIGISLSAAVLKNCVMPDSFDIAAFVCGSSDYIPLISQTRMLGKRTAVITMRNFGDMQHSSTQLHTKNVFTDCEPIFFDDHVDELRLIRQEQERECKSCGAKEITTWAGSEFYCSNCRSGYQRKR